MFHRLVIAAIAAGVSCVAAAQELAEFAPADLTLAKRLLVRHKVTELAFLRRDQGLIALADPPAALQWSAHKRSATSAGANAPWTFSTRTPLTLDAQSIRTLVNRNASAPPLADLRREYEILRPQREQVHASYIFIPRRAAGISPRSAARRVEKLRRDLVRGTPFATLAAEYSQHESASRGGSVHATGRGHLPQAVESFAFSAEPGRTSPVIESDDGFHVLRVDARHTPAFEELRGELEERWLTDRLVFAQDANRRLVAAAANARRIAVASGHVVVLYDVNDETGEIKAAQAFVEIATIDALALTSGGNIVATSAAGEVAIRRLKEGGLREPIAGAAAPQSLLFSPNASVLALVSDKRVDIATIADRTVVASVQTSGTVTAAAFSLDSRTLITGDRSGNVELWDAATYERVRNGEAGYNARYWTERTWRRVAYKAAGAEVRCLAMHRAGRLFVAGFTDGRLDAFDLGTGGRVPLGPASPHNAPLIRAAFSDDGSVLVTVAEDDTVGVWGVPDDFNAGPKPRPRTFDELVAQHREVVRVHADLRTKREELVRLRDEYDQQARYLRDRLNRLMAHQSLPNWRAAERLPDGNGLLRGLQRAVGYRDELDAAIEVLRLAMIDLENMARFQVMEIKARRALGAEQFERFASKLEELSANAPGRPDPTIAPRRMPSFDRVWQYVLTGE